MKEFMLGVVSLIVIGLLCWWFISLLERGSFNKFKKKAEPEIDTFANDFSEYLTKRLFVNERVVYTFGLTGDSVVCRIDGKYEFYSDRTKAVTRLSELRVTNPKLSIDLRKIVFTYKNY